MKLIKFVLPLIVLFFYTSSSFAEEKKMDCESIDTSTGVGMLEKHRCKKGISPKEKVKWGDKIKKFLYKKKMN